MTEKGPKKNRLGNETSLYLQQHADNPVDWFPWGTEALKKAQEEDKPILVSIGYSSCHWCHVMERESFEDSEVAAFQNEHFISIKVDREERPDVDRIYMAACQLLSGGGGWPLNVFLLPDGRPFFAGTYFPPEPRHRRPSWMEVLKQIQELYVTEREDLVGQAQRLTQQISQAEGYRKEGDIPPKDLLDKLSHLLTRRFDRVNGGFGSAPKFPSVMSLELMLRNHIRSGNPELLSLVTLALDKMAAGGIYDHLGGGFHRYSVDAEWSVPHFEKMLYDNGLLLRLYAEGYRLTQDEDYAELLKEIAGYLQREMSHKDGSFYASQDADSEGEEGTFFVWNPEQFREVLGDELGDALAVWFGVTSAGNFGHNTTVLSRQMSLEAFIEHFQLSTEDASQKIFEGKRKLWEARENREKPTRDEKRVTSWSALVIQGLARSSALLGDSALLKLAANAGEFYLSQLSKSRGKLPRVYADNGEGKGVWSKHGFLDDYAFMGLAFLDLFMADGDWKWVDGAKTLQDAILSEFFDREKGALSFTPSDGENLVVTPHSGVDQAVPSSVAATVILLQRLALLFPSQEGTEVIERIIISHAKSIKRLPLGYTSMLMALDHFHFGLKMVVAVVPEGAATSTKEALREQLAGVVTHNDLFVIIEDGEVVPEAYEHLLSGRQSDGKGPAFFVCTEGTCSAPLAEISDIQGVLDTLRPAGR